jgi:hypothetical protein
VLADGKPVPPIVSNDLSRAFVAPGGAGDVAWSITFAASAPQAADIVLFERRTGTPAGDCASWKEP